MNKIKKAFTLIELLVVMIIMWIIFWIIASQVRTHKMQWYDQTFFYVYEEIWKTININNYLHNNKLPDYVEINFKLIWPIETYAYYATWNNQYDKVKVWHSNTIMTTVWINKKNGDRIKLGNWQFLIIKKDFKEDDFSKQNSIILKDIDWSEIDITSSIKDFCFLNIERRKYCIMPDLSIYLK